MKVDNEIQGKISVLVIEDNEGDFILVETFLYEKFQHIDIKHTKNYEDSKAYIEEFKSNISIILLDLHLPDLSGIDLIKNILSIAPTVPIIILTGYSEVTIAQKSLQLGVYDFIIKDELNPTLLHKSIDFAINRKYFISQIESERLNYENLFNFSPQPMWLLETEHLKILNANYSAIEKYGYSVSEYQNMSFLELHPQGERERIFEKLLSENYFNNSNDFSHYLKNGQQINVDIYCDKVKIKAGENRVIVQSNDVTERLNHINTIELQNNKLTDIAWTQSHVVRAPLSRILGIVNLIENHYDQLDDLLKMVQLLKISANEMDEIVRKIVKEAVEIGQDKDVR